MEQELALNEADLRALEVVKITAEHPKKGMTDYEGVRLNALLDLAEVKPEAKKLVLTADDGFVAEVFLAEVQSCADCLVAFTRHTRQVQPGHARPAQQRLGQETSYRFEVQ